jgi:hypothetical protein
MVGCEACGYYNELSGFPGSLLYDTQTNESTDWALLEALPADLLTREFHLHLRQIEKEIADERLHKHNLARAIDPGAYDPEPPPRGEFLAGRGDGDWQDNLPRYPGGTTGA